MKRLLFVIVMLVGCLAAEAQQIHVLESGWSFSETGKDQWKPAYVPGNVHRDLQMNNVIPDPTMGENYKQCQWVETKDWEYKVTFSYPDLFRFQNIELVLEGLDTYADVYLNDSLILQAENMFVGYTVPVTKALKQENTLRVVFHNPVDHSKDLVKQAGIRYPADNDPSAPFTRKAAFHYGWDFTQGHLTCGIWRKVYLRGWNAFIIRDLSVRTVSVTEGIAQMESTIEIESSAADTLHINLVANGRMFKNPVKKGLNVFTFPFTVFRAELWWPNGMGGQKLYAFHVQANNRKFSSWKEIKYGIRTVEVVNQADETGKSFLLKVNGIPVYMKGCNYVPSLNMYRADAPPDPYTSLFSAMRSCHMNMVRVWGGGIYEDDAFYDLADRMGILVWQDFMFANTMYPADPMFLENVEQELAYNIKRLRHHASLALWCGNNEIEVAWKNWGWQKKYGYTAADSIKLWNDYLLLFKTAGLAVKAHDNGRFYLASSPQSNWGRAEDFNSGDNHYWGVWHGEEPFEAFNTHVPRFASEFGFQSFPEMNSVKKFSSPSDWSINTPVMSAHQFSYKGNGLISKYMERYYKKPKDFGAYVYLSQLLQAEGLKTAIEAQRRSFPRCMGSLYWQLNDCWPSASWSTIDYYGKWKAGQYFVRKAFAPLGLFIYEKNNSLELKIDNQSSAMAGGTLTLRICRFDGSVIREWKSPVVVEKGKQWTVVKDTSFTKGIDKTACYAFAELTAEGKRISSAVHYFLPAKSLVLPKTRISSEVSTKGDTLVVTLKSNVLAKNVFVSAGDAVMINTVSDNYFDLLPGEERKVFFYSYKTEAEFKKELSVRSLRDTY